jgi:MFS family permease
MPPAEDPDDPDSPGAPAPPRPPFARTPAHLAAAAPANDIGRGPGAHGRPRPELQPQLDDRLLTPAFVALLAMQAAYGFSFSMFYLLPKYLATTGETAPRIGLVMSGFGLACIVTIPFLPAILRALGRRGALMAATTLLATAAAAFAIVDRPGWMAIPLRASEGVTWTIMFATAMTLTADMAPRRRLAQALGLAGAASLVMNALAPAVGEPLADRFGYRWAFGLAAVTALGAAALARRLPARYARGAAGSTAARNDNGGAAPAHAPAPQVDRAAASSRRAIYVVLGAGGLAFGTLFTFLAPFALEHGVRAIRLFFIGYTAASLTVRLLGGRMTDRLGHRAVATAATVLYGVAVASAGLLGVRHLLGLGLLFGVAHGTVFPALMALLIHDIAPERRPRILGIANGAMSLGVTAVFAAGVISARIGFPAMFAIAGALATLSAAGLLRTRPRQGPGPRPAKDSLEVPATSAGGRRPPALTRMARQPR